MSTIFPLREKVSLDDGREPRLVDLDDDVADEVFKTLSSGTTRKIFSELHQSPQTASDLADVTETSVQNTQYHLEKLVDADLVEVVDTWYSERGTEMKVYAPTDDALVLFAGRDKQGTLKSLLKRVAGIGGILLPASVVAGWIVGSDLLGGAAGGAGDTISASADGVSAASEAARAASAGADPALLAGLAFFLGGAFVLAVAGLAWYWRSRRSQF